MEYYETIMKKEQLIKRLSLTCWFIYKILEVIYMYVCERAKHSERYPAKSKHQEKSTEMWQYAHEEKKYRTSQTEWDTAAVSGRWA